MQGKIALEEHWAIEDSLLGNMGMTSTPNWTDIRSRLLDTQDLRLAEMDAHGIELTILSLNAPAIQVDPAGRAQGDHGSPAPSLAERAQRLAGSAATPSVHFSRGVSFYGGVRVHFWGGDLH